MYSRQNDRSRELRIPRNYSGNVIFSTPSGEDLIKQHTPKDIPPRRRFTDSAEKPSDYAEQSVPTKEPEQAPDPEMREPEFVEPEEDDTPRERAESKAASLLSPIGVLGSEELLLIALALIIFQGGKEPEIALLLLALLFIN